MRKPSAVACALLIASVVTIDRLDDSATRETVATAMLLGDSSAIQLIRRSVAALAPLGTHMLFRGEPGTGRRTCAEVMHRAGPLGARDLLKVSLATAESQIDMQLFGERGVVGLAAQARGTTLYLDGIERLSLAQQERLCGCMAEGGTPGVRVLAASTRPLETWVQLGRFSRRLYERLALLQISVPPLRDRVPDIAPIALHAVAVWNERQRASPRRFGAGALTVLETHGWPGNVRELVETVHRACADTRARRISAERLRLVLGRRPRRAVAADVVPLREIECDYIRHVVARLGANQSLAARRLGISRNTLARKLRECERRADRAAS